MATVDTGELRRQLEIAQALSGAPQQRTLSPVAAGIGGLARVLAGRRANKLGQQIQQREEQQRQADMQAFQSGDIASIRDPRLQQIAAVMAGNNQSAQMQMLRDQLAASQRQEDIAREDRRTQEGREFQLQRDEANSQRRIKEAQQRAEIVSPADQIRVDEAEREQRGREESARSAVSLALRLKDNPATKKLFGRVDGRTPDVDQDVIDADADRQQLVEILTLANTDRMTGVLSESDIQILRAAGTLLENRLISDQRASDEIDNVIEVFRRNPDATEIVEDLLSGREGGGEGVVLTHPEFGDVTEEDIQETMRANNLTREQVLERLNAR